MLFRSLKILLNAVAVAVVLKLEVAGVLSFKYFSSGLSLSLTVLRVPVPVFSSKFIGRTFY